MFDKFADYMQYLLPSAFKRRKKQNQLLIYCRAVGRLYDALLQSALRLREETMLATCSSDMLEIFGHDYDMPRMQGETDELYRRRLQMKALTAATAGTQQGILYALASVGYDNCTITPFYTTDPDRWAEICINVFTPGVDEDNPIVFKCVAAEVMKVKKASTLPHWRFYYPAEIWHTGINSIQTMVQFTLYIQFWRDCIYNGQNQYDGILQYDAMRNYRVNTLLVNSLRIYTGQAAENMDINTKVRIQNRGLVSAVINSCYSISFWGCALYSGQNQYDGILQYDAKRRYGMRGGVRIHVAVVSAQEKIGNFYVETCRNVAYFDGTLRFDGTAKYDALYQKEELK